MTTLAQASGQQAASVLLWLAVLVVVAGAAGLLGWLLLRRLQRQLDPGDPGEAFTLGDLRQMHREGKLTDEEFARAKAAMIAQVKARTAVDDEPGTDDDDTGAQPDAGDDIDPDFDSDSTDDADTDTDADDFPPPRR